jgi:hypothetical protein
MTKKKNTECQVKSTKHSGSEIKIILLFCLVAVCMILSVTLAFSSNGSISNVVNGFSVTYESDQDANTAAFTDGVLTFYIDTETSSSSCGPKYTARSGMLTFTNSGSTDTVLSFEYYVSGNGTTQINGLLGINGPGSYSEVVAPGASLTISLESYAGKNGTESIYLYNIDSSAPETSHLLTVTSSAGGTASVDGTTISDSYTANVSYGTEISLLATPQSGFEFVGWTDQNNSIISTTASATVKLTEDKAIKAVFAETGAPYFRVENTLYSDFASAALAAQNSQNKLLLLYKNAVLPAGNYTVPNGVTFVIPFDAYYTCFKDMPLVVYGSHTTPSAFRTLTLDEGASLIVESGASLCVPSVISASGQNASSYNGTPSGKHGRINLMDGSSITVNNGGSLFCYGYIAGDGTVEALSGANIREAFQIRSWRGGDASSNLIGSEDHIPFFPFNQYYIQNIEAELVLHAGASESVFTAVNALGKAWDANAIFIGDNGLFQIIDGIVTKKYDSIRDRLVVTVNGNVALSSLTLNDLPVVGTVSTSGVLSLPINGNITINVNSGSTTIGENISFLPGSEIFVAEGAELELIAGKNVCLYDEDNWGPYAGQGINFVPVGYSTANGVTAIRTVADLTDVTLDLNGTLTLNGNIYTTGSDGDTTVGANITSSSKTGRIVFAANDPASYEYTMEVTQSGTAITIVPIPITSAKLHNADGSYTLTTGAADGDTYVYCPVCDEWGLDEDHVHYFTVTWMNPDGKTVFATESVAYGQMPVGPAELPVIDDDAKFTYVFTSWYPKLSAVTQDVSYVPEYYALEVDHADAAIDTSLSSGGVYMTLYNTLSMNYLIPNSIMTGGTYQNVRMVITLDNGATAVSNGVPHKTDPYYVFSFNNLNPKYLNTKLYAVIYAEKNGVTCRSKMFSFSVASYARMMLNDSRNGAETRKLIIDLLNYGAAAQKFTGHRVNDLANSILTESEIQEFPLTIPETENAFALEGTVTSPSARWTGASLTLTNGFTVNLVLHADDITGLRIKIEYADGRTKIVKSPRFRAASGSGNYEVVFTDYNFAQIDEVRRFTVLNANNEPVSKTLVFSCESYINTSMNSSDVLLKDLVIALMNVGISAKAYAALHS